MPLQLQTRHRAVLFYFWIFPDGATPAVAACVKKSCTALPVLRGILSRQEWSWHRILNYYEFLHLCG